MKLSLTTPLAVLVDADDIIHLRAEDETGAFGILSGHADFLTALTLSVVSWRDRAGGEHHAAVRGGMLEMRRGRLINIATREAVIDDDLHRLETEVLTTFHHRREEELAARTDAQRLYLAAIRQICRFLGAARDSSVPGRPMSVPDSGFEP
jgi:F-type H+-transporting ATPase subunit epsilon